MNYQKGKIYKIESHLGDKIYIGSTTKEYLSQRMTSHRKDYNRWKLGKRGNVKSFELFEEYGIENCKILLLELCPCNSKDELSAKEANYIRTLKCVNKVIPGRTLMQYVEDNKDKILEKQKQYYETHKEQKKQYVEDNKDKIRQYKEDNKDKIKKYYEENKDKIKEYKCNYYQQTKEIKKQPFNCECGCIIQLTEKARHQRSKKHINLMKANEN